ncbi:hypothetical protein LAY57_09015 [Argonema antarcticum A004/B2]|nr:hypothetical protein [Argonema antarcticum A004/B2]
MTRNNQPNLLIKIIIVLFTVALGKNSLLAPKLGIPLITVFTPTLGQKAQRILTEIGKVAQDRISFGLSNSKMSLLMFGDLN